MTRARWTVVTVQRHGAALGPEEILVAVRVLDGPDPESVDRVVCDETAAQYDVGSLAMIPAAAYAKGLRLITLIAVNGKGENLDPGMTLRGE
jgi:hypothetical protein